VVVQKLTTALTRSARARSLAGAAHYMDGISRERLAHWATVRRAAGTNQRCVPVMAPGSPNYEAALRQVLGESPSLTAFVRDLAQGRLVAATEA